MAMVIMNDKIRIMSIVGARPNFIKIAPFVHAINLYNEANKQKCKFIEHILVHTGQHFDHNMSDLFFSELNIPHPDYHLGVSSGSHAYQVGQTMIEFEKVLLREKPDWVVVVGDVNATTACSITAKKHNFKVAHIEAGLRSNDWTMPEEINRLVTDRISDLLLTPCRFANANLKAEGISDGRIKRVGNIMIDSLEIYHSKAMDKDLNEVIRRNLITDADEDSRTSARFEPLMEGNFAVLTLHRPSNVDNLDTLGPLINVLSGIAEQLPIVFPVHPRTHEKLKEFGLLERALQNKWFYLLKPISYIELLGFNMHSKLIITDSGGLQEEAAVLGIPCLTLRWNTERPITLIENGGTNQIVGNNPINIRKAFDDVMLSPPKGKCPELWDGHTAERVLNALIKSL